MMDGVEKKNLRMFLSSRGANHQFESLLPKCQVMVYSSKLQAALPFLEVLEVVVGSTQPKKLSYNPLP